MQKPLGEMLLRFPCGCALLRLWFLKPWPPCFEWPWPMCDLSVVILMPDQMQREVHRQNHDWVWISHWESVFLYIFIVDISLNLFTGLQIGIAKRQTLWCPFVNIISKIEQKLFRNFKSKINETVHRRGENSAGQYNSRPFTVLAYTLLFRQYTRFASLHWFLNVAV